MGMSSFWKGFRGSSIFFFFSFSDVSIATIDRLGTVSDLLLGGEGDAALAEVVVIAEVNDNDPCSGGSSWAEEECLLSVREESNGVKR